ncbi:MAG: amino acid ABC transporter permease, partial [Wolinella sp.]
MKKHHSILENKPLGYLLAALFFVVLGYSMYLAGSSINYIWKWNTIPKYFAYQQTLSLESPLNGELKILSDREIEIVSDGEHRKLEVSGYSLEYADGEMIYEGDVL